MGTNMNQVLRMKEGTDETSYAKTSYIQEQVLVLTKPLREKTIREFYCNKPSTTLCIADLGCSSSEANTLTMVAGLIDAVETARRIIGHGSGSGSQVYQVYLNDLPLNDFNTIFRSLPYLKNKVKQQMGYNYGHCFVNGTPGSFYDRLFPPNRLHFVHSSCSLHWLSQVPKGIEDSKRSIHMATRTSPPKLIKAYYDQFEKDFTTFLKCRSEEVVAHGRMVLTFLGSKSNEQIDEETCSYYMWKLLSIVLNDMVCEGLIEEKKLNKFNIPTYFPSASELIYLVEKEGSFSLNEVQVSELSWDGSEYYKKQYNKAFNIDEFAKCMRSVVEPLLTSHFGEIIIEDIFQRYTEIIRVSMDKKKNVYVNVSVSLTRKTS